MQDQLRPEPAKFAELLKEGRKFDKLDRDRAEVFASLLKHPGWMIYEDMLQGQIQQFGDLVLEPVAGLDGVFTQEFIKGTLKGLILARDMPSVIVESMKQEVPKEEDEE